MDRFPSLSVAGATAALALGAAALAPSAASASLCPSTSSAIELLAEADVAFVGRFTERRGDRLIFAVDEGLKGSPGATVEVVPQYENSDASIDPPPGEPIGLTGRRNPDGSLRANACDRTAPENLRAAAAAPDTDCTAPRVTAIRALDRARTRRPTRFRIRLAGAEGRLDRLRIDWGDGSARTYRLDPEGADPIVTHRFRRSGVRRVTATASARPVLACGVFSLPRRVTSPPNTLAVRVR